MSNETNSAHGFTEGSEEEYDMPELSNAPVSPTSIEARDIKEQETFTVIGPTPLPNAKGVWMATVWNANTIRCRIYADSEAKALQDVNNFVNAAKIQSALAKDVEQLKNDLHTSNKCVDLYSGRIQHDKEVINNLREELDKLAAFKKYVHDRLDQVGVPADPNSPHKEHGCRIGGRLDIVLHVPTEEEVNTAAERYAFQVPFDGTRKFYNDDKHAGFYAGVVWYKKQRNGEDTTLPAP
ncbi:MAG: hypothetical protein QM762_12530 [Chryseolinea sp.]